ncbi:MAG: class I SAM-dependent methyltransferase [Lachnospiraceae bacterium]|nr:class I SAM-dependent methyltransferase [Lachnospiraceae bacterium]
MLKDAYAATVDEVADMTWETWIRETNQDDDRRYDELMDTCEGKSVLEFGCGNGGFLRRIKNVAARVTGIELMDAARENLTQEGISVY